MKTIVLSIVFLSFFIVAARSQSVFTSPMGGEEVIAGSARTISWNPSLVTGMLTLSLWDGEHGTWQNVFTNVPSEEGKIMWSVPENLQGKKFRIKLATTGAAKGSTLTRTFFTIQPPAAKTTSQSALAAPPVLLTVHPNPARNMAHICVPDLPAGTPVTMIVVNDAGQIVSTLYNATPDAELGLCCTLDCTSLPSGTYFARLWNDFIGQSVKLVIQH